MNQASNCSLATCPITATPPGVSRYSAFVSSCTQVSAPDDPVRSAIRDIRRAIAKNAEDFGGAFISETHQVDLTRERYGSLTIARFLLNQVSACDKFIFVLSGNSRGSSLDVGGHELTGTYFELELFQAAVLGKPIYRLDHLSADTQAIFELLRLFDFEFVQEARVCRGLDDEELVDAALSIVRGDKSAERWRIHPTLISSQRVYEGLMCCRDANFGASDRTSMHFLDLRRAANLSGRASDPNFDAVESLVHIRREDKLGSRMDEQLAWAWLVMRELLVARLINQDGSISIHDPKILAAWNLALTSWHGAASWSGMHGHTRLGVLPTLVTLTSVRAAIRRDQAQPSDVLDAFGTSAVDPHGAFASSYYSLAKLLAPAAKANVLARVHRHLDVAAAIDPKDRPGVCAVRASTFMLEGKHRRAVHEFEESIRLSRQSLKNDYELGAINCELGFAQLKAGDFRLGRESLQRGVGQLREAQQAGEAINAGPFVRALIKASYGSLITGHLVQASRLLEEAYQVATDSGVNAYLMRPELKYVGRLIYRARRT